MPVRDVLVTWSVWGRTATFLLLVLAFLRARPTVARALEGAGTANEATLAD